MLHTQRWAERHRSGREGQDRRADRGRRGKKIGSPLRINGLRGKGGECKFWSLVTQRGSAAHKDYGNPRANHREVEKNVISFIK